MKRYVITGVIRGIIIDHTYCHTHQEDDSEEEEDESEEEEEEEEEETKPPPKKQQQVCMAQWFMQNHCS